MTFLFNEYTGLSHLVLQWDCLKPFYFAKSLFSFAQFLGSARKCCLESFQAVVISSAKA